MTPVSQQILTALSAGISSEVAAYVFYLEASKKPEAAKFKKISKVWRSKRKSTSRFSRGNITRSLPPSSGFRWPMS